MDGYPPGSLNHNVPFLVASGLDTNDEDARQDSPSVDQGILLRSGIPPLESRETQVIKDHFDDVDANGKSWKGTDRNTPYRFRVKTVGRSFLLPPRKAQIPDSEEPTIPAPTLHSPFSPLSPSSALYPDGLIDVQWIKKHQELVPSIYASFYTLTSDPPSMLLNDNRIKSDVNDLKSALAKSGYKTRLALILLADSDVKVNPSGDGVQDRIENIRRGTALDPKSIFYIPVQESPAELRRVLDGILTVMYNSSMEYYRDLGRHAKKKRSRGFVPQPTLPPTSGTSRTLSLPDWSFRYDFKAAVLSEFRQETDVTIKAYEQAYEMLLGQDVLDVIPSWSPRWNEARLLSDIITIRCLRIHLWVGNTSLAVRRWQAHRDRIGDFVDRRGRGTNNYGWQAWEARWATVMANLIEKVEIPSLSANSMTLYVSPEKNMLAERLEPWELLHHTGYWYRIAARHLAARRTLAHMMPEDDRQPPETTQSSHAGSQSYAYDTYMCPEPYEEYPLSGSGIEHTKLIVDCLMTARSQFIARDQLRIAAEISIECAREWASVEVWNEVITALQPLWENMLFRSEWWLDISEDYSWLLRRAAAESGRADLVVAIDWELINKKYTRRPQWQYNLSNSLDGVVTSTKPSITLSDEVVSPIVSAAFVFRNKEGRAGDRCTAQLSLTSNALPNSTPIALSSIQVEFEGSLRPIVLEHSDDEEQAVNGLIISSVVLTESFAESVDDGKPSRLSGQCNLRLRPGETRVLEMTIPLREAGDTQASGLVLSYRGESYDADYSLKFRESDGIVGWFIKGSRTPRHARSNAHTLHIQPRPPKMEIKLVDVIEQYYANETIQMQVELLNAEDEAANVKLDVHLFGREVPGLMTTINDEEHKADAAAEEAKITGLVLGTIDTAGSKKVTLTINAVNSPTTLDLHLRATYHLQSDAATPIMQMLPVQINVVNAFEANYDLTPRLHPDPWPSLFDWESLPSANGDDSTAVEAKGLAQKWCLVCHYASFALEELVVVGMDVKILSTVGDARCTIASRPELPEDGIAVGPKTMREARFDIITQKLKVEDRQPVSLELGVVISWKRRREDAAVVTTTMPVGRYLVLGMEPRVLASVFHSAPEGLGLMHLDITIENPSNHLLTFGLTVEPSSEFAFSGAKQTTMNLLPMSRRTATYRLLPLVRGRYIRAALVVRDKYFQKVLRIIPTEGMKIDKDGLLLWVPGSNEDEEEEEDGESKGKQE